MENTYLAGLLASVVFLATFLGTLIFFVRSWKDGYWGKHGEEVKYRVFDDTSGSLPTAQDRDRKEAADASMKGIAHA